MKRVAKAEVATKVVVEGCGVSMKVSRLTQQAAEAPPVLTKICPGWARERGEGSDTFWLQTEPLSSS
jgi:hypothetical protein